jgi:hypothetical protein
LNIGLKEADDTAVGVEFYPGKHRAQQRRQCQQENTKEHFPNRAHF